MIRHLTKLVLFLMIQAGLYGAVTHFGEQPQPAPKPVVEVVVKPTADPAIDHQTKTENRLKTYLRSRLYSEWLANRSCIEEALKPPAGFGFVSKTALDYYCGDDYYFRATLDKEERLQNTTGERLILVGGSSVAMSHDSRLLEERYGRPPVNMGLQAMVGVRYMVQQVAPYVHQGDVVLLAVEHGTMLVPPEGEKTVTDMLRDHCPEAVIYLEPRGFALAVEQEAPQRQWSDVKRYGDREALAEFASHLRTVTEMAWRNSFGPSREEVLAAESEEAARLTQEAARREQEKLDRKFEQALEPLVNRLREHAFLFSIQGTVFSRAGCNEYGDLVLHWGRGPQPNIKPLTPLGSRIHGNPALLDNIALLNAFAEHCQSKGAKVYFMHPPLIRNPETEQSGPVYEELLARELRLPILYPISESYVTEAELFDTPYHLNWSGISRRMEVICTALDREIGVKNPLSVSEQVAQRNQAVRGSDKFLTTLAADERRLKNLAASEPPKVAAEPTKTNRL